MVTNANDAGTNGFLETNHIREYAPNVKVRIGINHEKKFDIIS
jgi:hypothetical protein